MLKTIFGQVDHLYTPGIKEGLKCCTEESLVKSQNIDYLSLQIVDDVGGRI